MMTDEQRYILNIVTFQKRIAEIAQTEIDNICHGRSRESSSVRQQIEYILDDYFGSAIQDDNNAEKINEVIELAGFHGFEVEYSYPDGEKGTEKAVPIGELKTILHEVFTPDESED